VHDFCDWLDSFLSLEVMEWGIIITLLAVLIIMFITEERENRWENAKPAGRNSIKQHRESFALAGNTPGRQRTSNFAIHAAQTTSVFIPENTA
jgi:hypothetical protein